MWYQNAYRRHLCDMHLTDWDDSFFSEFSPECYVENLKLAKVQNAMIYFQSHVGLCYYPTECGVMHRAFLGREDLIRRVCDLCHENGIAVTGYYSLIFNTLEHDRHPSWRMIQGNGKSQRENQTGKPSRYGFCCPNNPEYRAFVYQQIDEMLAYFKVEGMFFDMPFWPHTCYCEHCRARFQKETGIPFPEVKPAEGTEMRMLLMRKFHEWMGDFVQSVTAHVKRINPALSVEHNMAGGISGHSDNGCADEVNEACDFAGGDYYGGAVINSFTCKYFRSISKNQPFEKMFPRCKPRLSMHTMTKSEDEMLAEVMMTVAHHGATLFIDAIDPVGTLDDRVYERVGRIFEKQMEYEPYFEGEMIEDIGLYYGARSRLNGLNSRDGSLGASRALIEAHIPFTVTGNHRALDTHRALVIPMLTPLEDADKRILEYIKNGGRVYFSGAACPDLLTVLTGGKLLGYTDEANAYYAPKPDYEDTFLGFNAKYPLSFQLSAPKVEGCTNGTVLATLTLPYTTEEEERFASIHSDPPGIATDYPAVLEGSYGAGHFIWSALPMEALEMEEYRMIFLNLLDRLTGDLKKSLVGTIPDDVEITLFENEEGILVNAIHLSERVKMPDVAAFPVGVRCDFPARAVELLPTHEEIAFEQKDGYVRFNTLPMHVFAMYRILR